MWIYVTRRLLYTIPILFGVLFLTFIIFEQVTEPSAVAKQTLGEKANETQVVMWLVQNDYGELNEAGQKRLDTLVARSEQQAAELDAKIKNAAAEADKAARAKAEENKSDAESSETPDNAESSETHDDADGEDGAAEDAEGEEGPVEGAEGDTAAAEPSERDDDAQAADADEKKEDATTALSLSVEEHLVLDGFFARFGRYVGDLMTFDFGKNREKRPVLEVISAGIWPSLKLSIPAFILSELLGVFFALFAALYRNTRIDRALVIGSVLLMSISPVAFIIFAQKFIAADWQYLPVSGYAGGIGGFVYLLLPIFIYVTVRLGEYVRFNRILMLDEVGQDYVRTARAKGLDQNTILFKHVLRNAMIPLITRWIIAIPYLYLGSLLLEAFFGIPGLGYLTVNAVQNTDINMVRALVFVGTLLYIFATVLADVLYAVVDPRIKLE